jgi:hypothetical protein
MTWRIEQSGASVSGTVALTDTTAGITGQGTVSGTVSGSSLAFTLRVPAGGFSEPWTGCTAEVTGSADVSGSSMSGNYKGSNSCTGVVSSGQFTLTKS